MQSQISEEIHRIRGPRDPRDQVYDGVIAIDSDPGCLPSVAVVLVGAITGRKILLFFALFPPHQHKTTAQGSRMHTSSILRLRLLHSSASPIFGPHQVPHVSLSVVKHSQQHQQRLQASQYAPCFS
ncbi:hypothetical protein N7G274_010545 [Stereocaulon virgatum]|uniref:Uncharacterized protein n=1 Tax=Stereocaulon virgatum TaxID=373712 RepID=A0ABR3ZVL1_9LECA